MEDYFQFDFEDETIHHDTYRQKHNDSKEKSNAHILDEIIVILKSLINIFDVISKNIDNNKK